jgi:hypothetical protein
MMASESRQKWSVDVKTTDGRASLGDFREVGVRKFLLAAEIAGQVRQLNVRIIGEPIGGEASIKGIFGSGRK